MKEKPHPLKGKKKSAEAIAKMLQTRALRRAEREARGEQPKKRKSRKRVETRNFEQLSRDVGEAIWCLECAISRTRRKIRTGELPLNNVTDEETFMYMAMRYLEGGLKP